MEDAVEYFVMEAGRVKPKDFQGNYQCILIELSVDHGVKYLCCSIIWHRCEKRKFGMKSNTLEERVLSCSLESKEIVFTLTALACVAITLYGEVARSRSNLNTQRSKIRRWSSNQIMQKLIHVTCWKVLTRKVYQDQFQRWDYHLSLQAENIRRAQMWDLFISSNDYHRGEQPCSSKFECRSTISW